MDLAKIERVLIDLRLANEVEAAAEMDVADAKAKVLFHTRKMAAMEERLAECREATQKVCDRLGDLVNQETMAPLLLTQICTDAS